MLQKEEVEEEAAVTMEEEEREYSVNWGFHPFHLPLPHTHPAWDMRKPSLLEDALGSPSISVASSANSLILLAWDPLGGLERLPFQSLIARHAGGGGEVGVGRICSHYITYK